MDAGRRHEAPDRLLGREAVALNRAFMKEGHEIVVATPGAVVATVAEASLTASAANGGQEGADNCVRSTSGRVARPA
jgi:hypothetical protein